LTTPRTAIIVGGGIAGIAAALRLSERGVAVTLVETRKKLGGRATSFVDARTGMTIDNCQHVAMACCTNYLDLCGRLGVLDKIRWQRDIFWVEEGGRVSVMQPGMLPAPMHFAVSFLAVRFLSAREKVRASMAMRAVLTADRALWKHATFAEWLGAQSQPRSLIEKFWAPIIVSACNLPPERASAASALHVFQEGFLSRRDAAMVGVAAVPLVELYDSAEAVLARAGGAIRLGTGIERLWTDRVVTTGGEELRADAVICAVPPERAVRIVAPELQERDARFERMSRITHSPILGVHLAFDRPVLPMHSAVLVNRATQWLFRKSPPGEPASMLGSHVHAVISAADEWIALDEEEITRRVVADVHACFPASREAKLISSRPVKEKLATFAATPEVEGLRPGSFGESGLILAGDYVQTGWPATMEGAARSGYMAAAEVLRCGVEEVLAPSLKRTRLVRLMAR
jgi:zeta-carotene desaturase